MTQAPVRSESFKYLGFITVAYVTFQLVSDVTAGKLVLLWRWPGSVALLYFPFTYILSDVLTEVYGYAQARRTLWQAMAASICAGLIYQLVVALPPATGFEGNEAYLRVFGIIPRVLFGGWIAVTTVRLKVE